MTRLAAIALVGAIALLVSSCTDNEPVTPTTSEPPAREVAIYLVRNGKVAPVRRVTTQGTNPVVNTVRMLLSGPTADEHREGYRTTLTLGSLSEYSSAGGTATAKPAPGNRLSPIGTAQLFHTLKQFPDVDRVVVDGRDVTPEMVEDETPQILIQSPLPGDEVSSPIRLRGTANVFEATVSIEVRDQTGTVVLEAFTTATSGTGTRGTFDTKLTLPSATGTMTIVAFESSAKDGSPLHVVDVQVTVNP